MQCYTREFQAFVRRRPAGADETPSNVRTQSPFASSLRRARLGQLPLSAAPYFPPWTCWALLSVADVHFDFGYRLAFRAVGFDVSTADDNNPGGMLRQPLPRSTQRRVKVRMEVPFGFAILAHSALHLTCRTPKESQLAGRRSQRCLRGNWPRFNAMAPLVWNPLERYRCLPLECLRRLVVHHVNGHTRRAIGCAMANCNAAYDIS
jgi:hypothetical protein